MSEKLTFGVVGLGAMGGGMTHALVDAGHRVLGVDPDPTACETARSVGAEIQSNLEELLDSADMIVICVATETALTDIYRRIATKIATGPQMVIETSTMAPDRAQSLSDISRASGRRHVEALLVGISQDAAAGRLYHFVGGDEADVAHARPFFDATGRAYKHLGPIGSGATAKVLNNAIGNATMLAFTEAIVAGEAAGIDPHAFIRAIEEAGGAGMSVVFGRHAHWAIGAEEQPPTPINRKDMSELADMLECHGLSYPLLSRAIRAFAILPETPGLVQAYAQSLCSEKE
ncbi:MAG: NAD(P)-binding domain-containing protein [Pseudomonadota bacterium]